MCNLLCSGIGRFGVSISDGMFVATAMLEATAFEFVVTLNVMVTC